jgi:hypothetical protein
MQRRSRTHRTASIAQPRCRRAGPLLWALLFSAFGLAVLSPAHAEEPLWGEIASTLGKGFVNAMTRASYSDTIPFRHHGDAVTMTMSRTDLGTSVEYGLEPDIDLRLRVPYFSQTMQERFAGQSVRHLVSGMGEMQAGAKWRFWQAMDERHKDELAAFADITLPTGDNNLRDQHGALLPADLQPNTGNPAATLGFAANRHMSQGGYWLSSMFTAETASSRFRRGNLLELHASMGRRVRPLTRPDQIDWMGVIGLHFQQLGKDSALGHTVSDSGGSVLSAEVSFLGSQRTRGARLGILFPLRTDLGPGEAPPRREIRASFRASF